ncbi:MAG: membrane integrity-associated transporter subunit PqiC [Nitrospirae bacterium]|nr:membrane integrity-associated transporter subunit PqiC [Nitrospirota bacterium]
MNKRKLFICALFLLVFTFAACSMPETKIYSIGYSGQIISGSAKSSATAYLTIDAPRHLSQPYIVHRTSPYELTISKYSKWDSPPIETIRDIVKDSLIATGEFSEVKSSLASPAGKYEAKIYLRKFERFDEAEISYAELLFDISLISPEGKEVYKKRISKQIKLADKSLSILAKALNNAALEAAKEITKNITEALSSPR